jgi:hypothetical protein
MLELIRLHATDEFCRKEERIWDELPSCETDLGVMYLPPTIRSVVVEVATFYQMLAYLVAFNVVDERLAILPVHYRLQKTWAALYPFVERERILRGGYYTYLNTLEEFAKHVAAQDMTTLGEFVRSNMAKK